MISSRPHSLGLLAGLFLAAGLVWSAMLVTGAWLKVAEANVISVTGSARKNVKADLIIWRGWFSTDAKTLLEAQRKLKDSLAKVENFLVAQQVTNYLVSPISISEIYPRAKSGGEPQEAEVIGYRLSQSVEIKSSEVERIMKLDGETTALVEQGVPFTTTSPLFIYTKSGDAKVEMLAEATKDARLRAEQIAGQGGRQIEQLKSARMGVFQITPLHSSQSTWDGSNDSTALEKTVTSVVAATFSLK